MKYRLFDTDSHINEPPHTWQDRLPSKLKDRGFKVVELEDGDQAWVMEGASPRRLDSPGSTLASLALKVGGMENVTAEMAEQELHGKKKRFENYRQGNYEATARLEDMDLDGVDASVLYPGLGMNTLWTIEDSELRVASMSAYNDWLIEELCSHVLERLMGLACIPTGDGMETAVGELRRSVEKGHRGGIIDLYPDIPLHDPHYDPLWEAAQDLGVPLHWHRANGPTANIPRGMTVWGGSLQGDQPASVAARFFSSVVPAMYMLFNGVFHRFPGLNVVTAETDFGWLPFMMQICDEQETRYAAWFGSEGDKKPSDYVKAQLYCTFMDDVVGCSMLDYTGADNIMWSSDYPHGVTTWPKSSEYIEKNLGKRSQEERSKILAGNAARIYRLVN